MLFTDHKRKFIQGPLQDDRSSRVSDLNFCFEFRRSCFGISALRTANFILFVTVLNSPGKCWQQGFLYFETASFHVLFQYVIRRCDIGGSALTNVCPCLDYIPCNCLLSFSWSHYLSPTHVQYLTIVSGRLLDRSWTESNHVMLSLFQYYIKRRFCTAVVGLGVAFWKFFWGGLSKPLRKC